MKENLVKFDLISVRFEVVSILMVRIPEKGSQDDEKMPKTSFI